MKAGVEAVKASHSDLGIVVDTVSLLSFLLYRLQCMMWLPCPQVTLHRGLYWQMQFGC